MADFVKWSLCKCLHCLVNPLLRLVCQRINCGSKWTINGTVTVLEMSIFRSHNSMFSGCKSIAPRNRRFGFRLTKFRTFSLHTPPYFPCILSDFLRQEAHFINTISSIKAFYNLISKSLFLVIFPAKSRPKIHIRPGPFRLFSLKFQFKHFVLPHNVPPTTMHL